MFGVVFCSVNAIIQLCTLISIAIILR